MRLCAPEEQPSPASDRRDIFPSYFRGIVGDHSRVGLQEEIRCCSLNEGERSDCV